MSLDLMFITNKVDIAKAAQSAGVERIWIDLERIGKEERQRGLNTVKSNHKLEDIKKLRPVLNSSDLLVRVNPMYYNSVNEINKVINYGADIVMLPMFKTCKEVRKFISIVDKKAKVLLLLETKEAAENINEILDIDGIDEIHIGLNDLHLAYKKRFMFELLIDGTVENLCKHMRKKHFKFGFGGIARIGQGLVPAEYIIAEHYRLGSTSAILSRSFYDEERDSADCDFFNIGIEQIRIREDVCSNYSKLQFDLNTAILKKLISNVVEKRNT